MEIMIELSEEELREVSGGAGSASFSFSGTASGTTATVNGTLTIRTTASSASVSGSPTRRTGASSPAPALGGALNGRGRPHEAGRAPRAAAEAKEEAGEAKEEAGRAGRKQRARPAAQERRVCRGREGERRGQPRRVQENQPPRDGREPPCVVDIVTSWPVAAPLGSRPGGAGGARAAPTTGAARRGEISGPGRAAAGGEGIAMPAAT